MENVSGVTAWLRKKVIENGGDPERETLTLVKSNDGLPYFVDSTGEYWRVYLFIEGATCYDAVKDDNDFYQSAVAFGHFQRLLADYPAETLHETIKDFHNTPDRLEKFKKAVAEDICGRAASVQKEIDFILEREELTHALYDLQLDGRLPLRVTHNDTKLNNIMIDDETGKAICVIDLDTVMAWPYLQMILAILFVLEQVLRWKMSRIFQRYPVIFIFLMYMRGDLLKDVEEH